MHLVHWGKKYKHGALGEARNLSKALDCFLRGAQKGSAAAMVDAGLMLWERGDRAEAVRWYEQAAEMGDRVGQTNLAVALQLGRGGGSPSLIQVREKCK
jgi:TPR repeat protein